MPSEAELADPIDSDAAREKNEQDATEARERMDATLAADLQQTITTLQQNVSTVGRLDLDYPAIHEAWETPEFPVNEEVMPTGNADLNTYMDKLTTLLTDNCALPDANARQSRNLNRYLCGVMGLSEVINPREAYEIMNRAIHGETMEDISVQDAVKQQLDALIHNWNRNPDALWSSMADYVRNNPDLTNADLVYFMQYTQQLFDPQGSFFWIADAKAELIGELINRGSFGATQKANQIASASNLTDFSSGQTLPPAVAANCLALAFAAMT